MSINENDSIYNSSGNEGESEAILSPSSLPGLPSNSSRPLPDMISQSVISSQSKQNFGEVDLVGQGSQESELELGLDLGRKLARLELGNELNKEQLGRIKQQCQINEESLVLENSRIDDLDGKVLTMEARLLSEEKQGFDAKEQTGNLEKNLKTNNKEILELREIIAKQITKQAKQEERFCRLEQANCELRSQFVILLETCETFNDELQSLKKMNFDLKKELEKKENSTVPESKNTSPIPGSYPNLPNYPTRVIQNSNPITSASTSGLQEGTSKTGATTKCKQSLNYGQEFVLEEYPNYYYAAPIEPAVYSASSEPIYSAPSEPFYASSSGSIYNAPIEPIFSASSDPIFSPSSGSIYYPQPAHDPQSNVIYDRGPQGAGLEDLEAIHNSVNSDFNDYYYQ